MKIKVYLFLIILGMIFTSCDKENFIHYTMENKTEDSIKCVYSFGESYFDNQAKDKTIFLKGNQKDTLFIFTQISPGVYDPEDGKKMIYIINVDILRLKDNTMIKKDVTLRKNWNFRKTEKNSALMEFEMNDSDFAPAAWRSGGFH
jgi:hypothetical protein